MIVCVTQNICTPVRPYNRPINHLWTSDPFTSKAFLEWLADACCQEVSVNVCAWVRERECEHGRAHVWGLWMCTWVRESERETGWSGVRDRRHTISLLTSVINSSCLGVSAVVGVRGGRQECECCWREMGCRGWRGGWGGVGTLAVKQLGEVTTRPCWIQPAGLHWQSKFQHPGVHLSFPLKPPSNPSYSPSEQHGEGGWRAVQQPHLKATGAILKWGTT